jgi:hypothetical protein
MKTHVEVIRLNGNSTEMKDGVQRIFKRQLNLPWVADGFIVRQIQVGTVGEPVVLGVHTIGTDLMGSQQEIACFTESISVTACPQTIFSSPVKSGTYNFTMYAGYLSEDNTKSTIDTGCVSDVVLILEFVKFK